MTNYANAEKYSPFTVHEKLNIQIPASASASASASAPTPLISEILSSIAPAPAHETVLFEPEKKKTENYSEFDEDDKEKLKLCFETIYSATKFEENDDNDDDDIINNDHDRHDHHTPKYSHFFSDDYLDDVDDANAPPFATEY